MYLLSCLLSSAPLGPFVLSGRSTQAILFSRTSFSCAYLRLFPTPRSLLFLLSTSMPIPLLFRLHAITLSHKEDHFNPLISLLVLFTREAQNVSMEQRIERKKRSTGKKKKTRRRKKHFRSSAFSQLKGYGHSRLPLCTSHKSTNHPAFSLPMRSTH